VTVVVGVDGAGRTHRLGALVAAATVPVTTVDGTLTLDDVTARLAEARDGGHLVVVDDADRLPDGILAALAAAARQGVSLAVARRPTLDRPELAALDEAVSARGVVEVLEPLDDDGVAAVVAAVTGGPAGLDTLGPLREAAAGLPAIVAMLATVPPGDLPPALVARMQQRLARLPGPTAALARTLALGLALTDDVLAAAAGVHPDALAAAMRTLHDHGMLVPGGEQMVPAVARAVLAELPPAGRRRLHEAVASALLASGSDPVTAAEQLRTARARSPAAATAYAAAGDRLRFTDPAMAAIWYDLAGEAGVDGATLAAGVAETEALLGRPVLLDTPANSPAGAARLALVAGAVAAHQGRADRAGQALREAPAPGPVLAVPSLMATGNASDAHAAAETGARGAGAPVGLRRLAEAALAVGDPARALPLFIEAAETLEQAPPPVVLPDTAHAVGAVVAVLAGDAATADHLLERALATGLGGPVATTRHRLLLAWTRMRVGRFDTAVAELPQLEGALLGGRERLLAAALAAGIARRSGDFARLRQAWTAAEPVLARQSVDLFQVEAVEELLVAAARLREHRRIDPVLDTLDTILAGLGHPAAWTVAVGWIRLQVAVAGEDAAAAASAAAAVRDLDTAGAGPRQRAQCTAAQRWAGALAGQVDADAVLAAAGDLVAAQLPWEGSRLAGHAAIRTGDPVAARRLLEHAREMASLDALGAPGTPDGAHRGLSDREVEVARLVLAGRTHKEIGAQLYLSPKTVEHHVARIRTKLGATSRAELIAALRGMLAEES
jgi:DNA-binding CsgD family transcriptional regulator